MLIFSFASATVEAVLLQVLYATSLVEYKPTKVSSSSFRAFGVGTMMRYTIMFIYLELLIARELVSLLVNPNKSSATQQIDRV